MEHRPDPDALLRQVEQEQKQERSHGKLKIFFGYAAGVGKTYAMLEAAHAAKRSGMDVVIGYIEPHTRPETMALGAVKDVADLRRVVRNSEDVHEYTPNHTPEWEAAYQKMLSLMK